MDSYSCKDFEITFGKLSSRITMGGSECDCQDTCGCSTSECDRW